MGMFSFLQATQRPPEGPTLEERLNTRFDELANRLIRMEEANAILRHDNAQLRTKVEGFEKKEIEEQAKYDATDPWIKITSEGFDEVKGIAIGLDWNEAFIQYLKDNGLKGANDEDIVRKYVAFLYEDLLEKLEENVVEHASQKGKIADFE